MFNENQRYIHYGKGSVIMYALRDYIGEDTLNKTLADFLKTYSYQDPPYVTSVEFMNFIRDATPDSLEYLITDMFENITLYSNKTTDASYRKLDDGKYALYLNVESRKFRADSQGAELEVSLDDWIDVGVYANNDNGEEKLVYLKRKRLTKNKNEFEIMIDIEPTRAGIDPNHLLIDRFPSDNTKQTTLINF